MVNALLGIVKVHPIIASFRYLQTRMPAVGCCQPRSFPKKEQGPHISLRQLDQNLSGRDLCNALFSFSLPGGSIMHPPRHPQTDSGNPGCEGWSG